MFVELLSRLIPLYLLIAAGFVVGRYLKVERQQVATLLIYFIAPVVVFESIARIELKPAYFFLPIIIYVLCCLTGWLTFHACYNLMPDKRRNLAGAAASTFNTGYFGLPVFIALYGETNMGIYLFATLGTIFSESTVGYYLMARSHFTIKDSLKKLSRLPLIYASILGTLFSLFHLQVPQIITDVAPHFRGSYVLLGMMIIGLGLSTMQRLEIDRRFTGILLLQKFLVWPVLGFGLVWLDKYSVQIFDPIAQQIIVLLSVMPYAANTVAFASQLNVHPEKAATLVLISTLVALPFILLIL